MYLFVKDAIFKALIEQMGDDNYFKFSKRIRIWDDTEIFRYKEDISVWMQKKEKAVRHYSVFFDDVFIFGFDEDWSKERVLLQWWKGLRDQVKKCAIELDPFKRDQIKQDKENALKELEKEKKAAIDRLPTDDPIKKMAKEVVKRVNETPATTRSHTRRKKLNA